MKRKRQSRFGTFKCECGCGETFTGTYVTRAPRYVDKSHRNRKLAANKAARRVLKNRETEQLRKARRAALRSAGVKNKRLISFASMLPDSDYTLVFRDITRNAKPTNGGIGE